MEYFYLMSAILLICIAHFVRLIRWKLFIEVYEQADNKCLLQSMSVGYLLNYLMPFKLGDIVRAWISGRKMKNGLALGFSTVLVDRYLDVMSVGIVFVILSCFNSDNASFYNAALFYIIVAVIFIIMTALFYILKDILKKAVRLAAGIFNDNIESAILFFAWALIWNVKDIFLKINKGRMAVTTIGMWLLYVSSYYMFAGFLSALGEDTTWGDIFTLLFEQNGIFASTGSIVNIQGNSVSVFQPVYMAFYMVMPIVVLLVISVLRKQDKDINTSENENYLNLLPLLEPSERLAFLESYFSNSNREYIKNYLKINQDIFIIRDYSAGSNATTMLCMDGNRTFFRKYAFGEEGEKLYQQIQWIEANQDKLALPEIIKQSKTEIYCFYDMPYNSYAIGLFEYVHSMPINKSWMMIRKALESLETSIYTVNVRHADKENIDSYIKSKVNKNIEKIKAAKHIRDLQQYESIFINGVEYRNLAYYERYLSKSYLLGVFADDKYAVIHGDFTIENIICIRGAGEVDNFYIIDPNTGNIHDSPNLDYGKLLQSIHGGYEFLMSTKDISVTGNHIDFLFAKSSVYTELHKLLKDYMQNTFGEKRTKSIYYHEIIHWLRLMPYKIEKDGKRALLFYAGMLMVMNDVINMYEN